MSTIALRRYRIWMIFFTFINGLVMVGYYGYAFYVWSTYQNLTWELRPTVNTYDLMGIVTPRQPQPRPYGFYWQEWINLATAGVLFLISIIALVSHYNLPKYLRALLVAIPVALSLYVNIDYIIFVTGLKFVRSPLSCVSTSVMCYLTWSSRFMTIVTAAFVLVDIGLTLWWGPLRPKKNAVVEDEALEEHVPVERSQSPPPPQPEDDSEVTGAGINSQPQMTQV